MWSTSFNSESGFCPEGHVLALYVNVSNDLSGREMKDKLSRLMESNDTIKSVGGRGGIHVLFHLEIDIATDDAEVERKLSRLGYLRSEIERIYLGRTQSDEEEKTPFDDEFSAVSAPLSAGAAALRSRSTKLIDAFMNQRIFLTLSCNVINPTIMNFILQSGTDYKKPFDLFCLSYQDNRERTVTGIHMLYKEYASNGRIKIGLGMDVPKDELLWILNHISGEIRVYLVGYLSKIPNLHLRSMEIAHNKGINTMIILREQDLFQPKERLDFYSPLAQAYAKESNDSTVVFFVKCLMQIGFTIGLGADIAEDVLAKELFALKHPFVVRKVENSPTAKKKFFVQQEDIERIKEESERIESELEDRALLKKACGRVKFRILTFVAKKVVELDILHDLERIATEKGITIEEARRQMEEEAAASKAKRASVSLSLINHKKR